jgi:Luciferase-like monooxygenase
MDFCIGSCAKIDQVGWARQAEDVGASHFGVGEGPLLFSDPYQYLALAARETSSIKLGTWVTNPLTRIPAVTANSIATLNALAPGRTFLGIGTANNALRSMGNRPAKLAELDTALDITRGEPIVKASTDAAMAYLGDPTAPDAPHYLEVWAKYLRGLDPVHRPLITKELVDYWCLYGSPDQLWEKTQLMHEAGCDMVSVFLSNPFTAERDIADIGSSILARA